MTEIILLGPERPDPTMFGNKALGLWKLAKAGASVPPTLMVPVGFPVATLEQAQVTRRLGSHAEYLVRSSSPAEDSATRSMAGVFLSLATDLGGVVAAIVQVRHQAMQVTVGGGGCPIPVLIQPRVDGPGGVYLFDRAAGRDMLILSSLGSAAVTSGATAPTDQLPPDSLAHQTALTNCREVARKLGGSVDLELALGRGCVFLQYRPLTRPLTASQPEGLSSYFPTWLPPLVGSMWAEQLSAVFRTPCIRYEGGFILGLDTAADDSPDLALTPECLYQAEAFYTEKLIPDWESRYAGLADDSESLSPGAAWEKTTEAWTIFLDEYFNNPFERVVSAARATAPPGMAFSPRTLQRFDLFGRAGAAVRAGVAQGMVHRDLLALEAVQIYLESFGFYLLQGHDFSQPTLAEQPEVLLAQLAQAARIVIPELKKDDPVLRVAWLAEDDNEFKQRFLSLLRRCVLRLGRYLEEEGRLGLEHDIWSLTRADLLTLLRGAVLLGPREASPTQVRFVRARARPETFAAEVLAPGRASGRASRSISPAPNRILVRTVIETTDYSLLMGAAGAVVSLGTPLCHGAIFARDVGKPLFRCPAILSLIDDGTHLTLLDSPPCVRIGVETPCEGGRHED